MDASPFDLRTVYTIATMVDAGLIGLRHVVPWADAWVLKLDSPPLWLLELCMTRDVRVAQGLLITAACQRADPMGSDEHNAEYLACLFLRYRHGDLSWAAFLDEGGQQLDASNASRTCEELYGLLNALERDEHPADLEQVQSADIERSLRDALDRMEPLHRMFEALARAG
ncbi:hypothetical protein [Corallococcus llansteffanensis]|uniref:Uncharacterized protein n=1 Tax=Corallococcus llansteffanensis TaxID=2316731 RepID=A0A3A8PA58_9BACT|nr:hypothetical protein [Corallococcus llansteffanensis]RKH51411.1 hypothetical protein D7V93_29300 [Corallococcus llansteffanensis]